MSLTDAEILARNPGRIGPGKSESPERVIWLARRTEARDAAEARAVAAGIVVYDGNDELVTSFDELYAIWAAAEAEYEATHGPIPRPLFRSAIEQLFD